LLSDKTASVFPSSTLVNLADVIRRHGPAYLDKYGGRMLPSHRAAMDAIVRCHTPACGGSLYACDGCGEQRFAYHRCGNRACGQCGHTQARAWLDAQSERLLPVSYFLLTFTVPEPLRELFRSNQRVCYDLLFSESAAAFADIAGQPRYLGGETGMLGVLHTWTRQFIYHPHVHYLVPGVVLHSDGTPGFPSDPEYLVPVLRLSARFRSRVRQRLQFDYPKLYAQVPSHVWRYPWVVHCQHAGRGKEALRYLSRYIYKTAISSTRLISQDDQSVTFSYRDSATGIEQNRTLTGEEFLRRFLQHVLPRGFRRVRTYGWLSPAAKRRFEIVCTLLDARYAPRPLRLQVALIVIVCPHCKKAMRRIAQTERAPP
jgi:hypothetical protein